MALLMASIASTLRESARLLWVPEMFKSLRTLNVFRICVDEANEKGIVLQLVPNFAANL